MIPAAKMWLTVVSWQSATCRMKGAGFVQTDEAFCYVNPEAHVGQASKTYWVVFILLGLVMLNFPSRGMLALNDSPLRYEKKRIF